MAQDLFSTPEDISNFKWKFTLYKRYFDTGYGITNYIKYFIALFGLSSLHVGTTLILALIYAALCFFIGWAWFKYRFAEIDTEVGNQVNRFMREMREKIK